MKLIVEVLTGNLFYVEVGDNATVGDLKKETGNQENLPRDRLILMLNADDERYLLDKDEVPLKHYGVQDSSHIYIFFRPLSDGASASPSTPKESASSEPSPSTAFANKSEDEHSKEANDDVPSNEAKEDEPLNEVNEPPHSVDPSSAQMEE